MLILSVVLTNCSFPPGDFSNKGERTIVSCDRELLKYDGELLSVSSDTLYLMRDTRLTKLAFKDINKISIDRLSGNTMFWHGIIFQTFPAALLGIAAASSSIDEPFLVFAVTAIPGIITILISSATKEKDVEFTSPFNPETISQLRKYCRHYLELSDEQIKFMMYNQKVIRTNTGIQK